MSLPPIGTLTSSNLGATLATLFEPSEILDFVVPSLASELPKLGTYADLIDAAIQQVSELPVPQRAQFIAGHPRIGETKNLSALSAKEQGAAPSVAPTPPEVLARLAHLNTCYERSYPGLRYITFVNGRTRAAIALEIEDVLGISHSLSPSEPPVEEMVEIETGSDAWKAELDRAVVDVGRIAKNRLNNS
ncbi:Oxo-4-hydroxy-4-carboxy-5-ureidoimidazoline decarboxylase [Roridomyces roridus]|uniref:Oxo-4-hydroxy-4-carboxy-5-ureidoimidazoline decarboxylase n=1 Tax=Roridomyces roridus TaxID=1738132 RepID=A0AAD7BK49_9AGAR|nr:Oxo-4-hydroxy-4-carboxy-5-ureidoimidazoline decarboxylase [Roridomyces roridus]